MKEKEFLAFAEHLTGTPKNEIKIIWCGEDENGFYDGCIEIAGNREYIHSRSC